MKLDLIKSAKDTLKDFEKDAAKAGIGPIPLPGDPSCGDSCICARETTAADNFKTRTHC